LSGCAVDVTVDARSCANRPAALAFAACDHASPCEDRAWRAPPPRATMPPMTAPTFDFAVHAERLAICRLPATDAVPGWAQGGFVTVSRTAHELSVVCAQRHVPADVQHDRDKVGFGIVGVVPMTSVGILASLCRALADAAVPVFVISTYDTDYLLVSAPRFAAARAALQAQGHRFVGEPPAS